jgi:hypothetical protein
MAPIFGMHDLEFICCFTECRKRKTRLRETSDFLLPNGERSVWLVDLWLYNSLLSCRPGKVDFSQPTTQLDGLDFKE